MYCAARSEAKATKTIAQLLEKHPTIDKERVIWLPLDLERLESVQDATAKLRSLESKLDILSSFSPQLAHVGKAHLIDNFQLTTLEYLETQAFWTTVGRSTWRPSKDTEDPELLLQGV